ncbi:MAG TPA: hypothetical protein VJA18_04240 [Candidatus Nanoarchaeia archaeon]|nr:hypothetical protein [Candidatus Nanoarchaeia archaeon]
MEIEYSKHWLKKKLKKRKDITNDMIEYALSNSKELRDKEWKDALNAISKIPQSGRTLKVVYKKSKGKVFIITAFWLN